MEDLICTCGIGDAVDDIGHFLMCPKNGEHTEAVLEKSFGKTEDGTYHRIRKWRKMPYLENY